MKWDHHNPRGPRSCPSYAVSSRHHLIDPIRPTRGHIAFSPHGGLYAMPSLCGSAEATREWFRAFAIHSVLAYRPLRTPGSSIIVSSSAAMSTRPSPRVDRLGTPKTPAIRFTRAMTFVASWFTHLLRSASLLAPCTDLTGYPASGAFTSGLSAGWSPFPLQDITTTATGLLCWRDSHPLEWQLASLHLLLHRSGLAPSTPCRSPGALRSTPDKQTFSARVGMSQTCHEETHAAQQIASLFDHLVGAGEKRWRNGESDGACT